MCWLQSGRLQLGENELVNRGAHPSCVAPSGRLDGTQRLKGPMRASPLDPGVEHVRPLRPHGALIDPGPQDPDLLRRQPIPFGRHDEIVVNSGDCLDETTFGTVAADQDRSMLTPQGVPGELSVLALAAAAGPELEEATMMTTVVTSR